MYQLHIFYLDLNLRPALKILHFLELYQKLNDSCQIFCILFGNVNECMPKAQEAATFTTFKVGGEIQWNKPNSLIIQIFFPPINLVYKYKNLF